MRDLSIDRKNAEQFPFQGIREVSLHAIDRAIAAEKERDQLRTEHTAMKEALEWYAVEGNYKIFADETVILERGKRSRTALSTLKKEESHE